MGFGEKLGNLLKNKRMTVAELSKLTGISSSTLYAIIRRDSDNVNLSAVQKISSVLNVPVETLITSSEKASLGDIFNMFSGDYIDTDIDYIDVHFTTDEYTSDEIAEIIQFAEFIKSKRLKNSYDREPPTTEYVAPLPLFYATSTSCHIT